MGFPPPLALGLVESFQEVDLAAVPSFSDVVVNGGDADTAALMKSEEQDEKTESKKNGKTPSIVSKLYYYVTHAGKISVCTCMVIYNQLQLHVLVNSFAYKN